MFAAAAKWKGVAWIVGALAITSTATAEEVPFQSHFMLETLSEFPIHSFYLGAPAVGGVAYLPHSYPKFGARLFVKGVGIAATLPVDITHDDDRRGHSEQSSFIVSPFRRGFGFDLYYQAYKGLYEDNPFKELNGSPPARFPQLPNATVRNFGINSYIALDSTNYSLAAAFLQTEFQNTSGGSWVLEPFFNHVEINTGDLFTPSSDPDLPQVKPDLQSATLSTYGLGLGYGHAWISGRAYFTLLGALGGGYQNVDILRADGSAFSTTCAALKLNANGSTGFNFQRYVIGTKGLVDSIITSVNGTSITSTLINIQLYFGMRF